MKCSLYHAALISIVVLGACKEPNSKNNEQNNDEKDASEHDAEHEASQATVGAGFYAADSSSIQNNANFFFQIFPGAGFTRRLDDLPQSGEVSEENRPYSGNYYPETKGGTNVVMVGGKSPLQKYDLAFNGGSSKAADWEKANHSHVSDWFGHCNGFSAAATRHAKEPSRSVTRNNVVFAPQDIKGLLAEAYMEASFEFLGGNRCDPKGNPDKNIPPNCVNFNTDPLKRQDVKVMDVYEDINPSTLHAAVTNWIGRMKQGLVMDEYQGEQVWNYPFFKYQVLKQQEVSETEARRYVTGDVNPDYVFNPDATRFSYVQMRLTYSSASSTETLQQPSYKTLDLTYILELNAAGEIIGGEWVGSSQKNHPDFIWRPFLPEIKPNGGPEGANPYVDIEEVIKMWAESVGYDPNDAPKGLLRPEVKEDWAIWPTFSARLDGSKQGAVFAGKPIVLDITRMALLARGKVELSLLLNGQEIKKFTPADNEAISYAFTPGLGLNRLEFVWRKDGAQVADEFARFHVMR